MSESEKARRIDQLLGKLSIEQKIAQMFVFGQSGPYVDQWLMDFAAKYGLGGLRVTPNGGRKFIRYFKADNPAYKNVNRPTRWLEKKGLDSRIPSFAMTPEYYSGWLNDFRSRAMEGSGGAPMHVVSDFEGPVGNFSAPHLTSLPHSMSIATVSDMALVEDAYAALARQIKAVGIDWLHSPVVDVNVNPNNPEISQRSYSADPAVVAKYAAACVRGFDRSRLISTLKHFPGRGDSNTDAHFSVPVVEASAQAMRDIHLHPYAKLIEQGLVRSVMIAHTAYPNFDPQAEVATVSPFLVRDILRGELGFQGVVTTDSMTMGGLMARYDVCEAALRTIEYGTDLILLKDDNCLRQELFDAMRDAVRSGRLTEARIDESLQRLWSLKYDFGLFEKGGVVDPQQAEQIVRDADGASRTPVVALSRQVIHTLRDEEKVLPLKPGQHVLVVDHITENVRMRNDIWNHPGLFWEFMRQKNRETSYVDYQDETLADALAVIREFLPCTDVIVMTAEYTRGVPFAERLRFFETVASLGKPVVFVACNPYRELLIPDCMKTVVWNGALMHEQLEALADYLYRP